jgi:NADH-quinone oxidoreductase subunit M
MITTLTIFIPLLGAILMMLLPDEERLLRYAALGVAAIPLLLSVYVYFAFGEDLGVAALSQDITWIRSLNIGYRVGLDGLGFGMFFLSTFLTVIAILASWDVRRNLKQYFAAIFVAEVGMLGVFAAQDLILFYVFFELTLIPMYLLVGVWGDENRRPAAIKFFIYTFLGSTVMLAGFLAFGILADTYAMDALGGGGGLSRTAQVAVAAPILFGLLVKVPAVPLHSWLLDVYVSSPTSTNVLLSGVLPKLGTYGLISVAIPLLPQGVEPFLPYVAAFGVINIVYGAFVAFLQPDLKALVAYSSIGTLGFILLGAASGNAVGLNGAVFQQVSHGLYSALLFILVGVIAARTGTRRIGQDAVGRRAPRTRCPRRDGAARARSLRLRVHEHHGCLCDVPRTGSTRGAWDHSLRDVPALHARACDLRSDRASGIRGGSRRRARRDGLYRAPSGVARLARHLPSPAD